MDTKEKCRSCDRYVFEKNALAKYRRLCDQCLYKYEHPKETTVNKLIEQGLLKVKHVERKPPSPIQTYKELKQGVPRLEVQESVPQAILARRRPRKRI